MSNGEKIVLDLDAKRSYTIMIPEDFSISEKTINNDLATHAARYAHYNVMATLFNAKRDGAAAILKALRAKVDGEIRDALAKAGEKVTEAKITNLVELDKRVYDANCSYEQAAAEAATAYAVKEAFSQRKEMLVSLAANMRCEMDSGLRINKSERS